MPTNLHLPHSDSVLLHRWLQEVRMMCDVCKGTGVFPSADRDLGGVGVYTGFCHRCNGQRTVPKYPDGLRSYWLGRYEWPQVVWTQETETLWQLDLYRSKEHLDYDLEGEPCFPAVTAEHALYVTEECEKPTTAMTGSTVGSTRRG